MRREKSGSTMNAEFPNQREHSARKTHSINTRFVSPMQQRKESEGKGSTALEQSLRPLIYGFSTAPLWFLEPRSGVAARAPEVLVVRALVPAPVASMELGGSCGSCSQSWAHSRKSLETEWPWALGGHFGKTLDGGWHCYWVCWQDILVGIQSTLKEIYFYFKGKDCIRRLLGLFQPSYSALP